ncbi:MAG: hypothetical protein AAB420_00915 [Patescibacteria group bacterium]
MLPTPFTRAADCNLPFTYNPVPNSVFQNYESVEYINGYLVIHFKLNRQLSAYEQFFPRFIAYDAACASTPWGAPGFLYRADQPTPLNLRNLSLRFLSPTGWTWWDDDTNASPAGCWHCSGDISPTSNKIRINNQVYYGTSIIGDITSSGHPVREPVVGHSSVIFLPGLEASRLYRQDTFFENQLWDPNRHQDIQDLFLDESGQSIIPGIYTRDLVDTIDLSTANIYKSFINMMDGLVADDTIAEWKPLPYDWRFDLPDVVTNANMITEIEQAAAASDTGKVTIISHSNGGLVAKELINQLEAQGKADLVDKLILVAVPQMGTPKAMEALLHGEDVGFLKGLFVPRWITRGLAEHMQSAFNLLPTEDYFAKITDPVAEFDPNATSTVDLRATFGDSITTADEMRDFLTGMDGRAKPADRDISSPNVLFPSFVARSVIRAEEQDTWVPPAGLEIIQIAGWGIETLRGIRYTDQWDYHCGMGLTDCFWRKVIDQRPLTTTDGDKTVISYSADKMGGERYYVNIKRHNDELFGARINRDHGDILEVPEVLSSVTSLIKSDDVTLGSIILTTKPIDPVLKNRLSVHSPVSIDVYDLSGNHVGLLPPKPDSDIQLLDEQIPNSQYYEFGEGKYISVPDGQTYNVVIKGTGLGEFDFELDDVVLYTNIPVNPHTIATITIGDTAPVLSLDVDGDGTIDANIPEGYTLSAASLLDILEYNIKQLTLSPRLQKRFDRKITFVRGSITKEQITNANRRLDSLTKDIKTYVSKGYITFEQGEVLMGLIQQIKTAIK